MTERKTFAAVACGVLEWNLRRAIEESGSSVSLTVLPAGLHDNPAELRRRLQAELDRLDAVEGLDGVIVGYGLCGRGVVGIRAGRHPLAIPRCEDCTAVFLGSQRRYRSEFARFPGTRYFTCGWFRAPRRDRFGTPENRSLYDPGYGDLVRRFGEDNARFIVEFRNSWRRNYQRAAYVRYDGDDSYAEQAARVRALAEAEGWRYEELEGDESLFRRLVEGRWDHPDVVVVRPGERVVGAPGAELMGAGHDVEAAVTPALERFRRRSERHPQESASSDADSSGGRHLRMPTPHCARRGIGLGIDAGGTYTDSVLYDFHTGAVLSWSKALTTHHDLALGIARSLEGLDVERLRRVTRVALSTTLATNAIVEGRGQAVGLLLMGIDPSDLERIPFRHKRLIPGRMSIEGVEQEAVDEAATRRAAEALAASGARAFAVSGHAGVINPSHELAAARVVWEATGRPVVCGHQLTRDLGLFRRTTTAALNARLLPLIGDLVRGVRGVLAAKGLTGPPLMVVCGDGTQVLDRYAERFPVQTVLSGPAASVIGALALTGRRDAIVADMGGTTLDVAVVREGAPILSAEGAEIGGFATCVRAMRIHTVGLGGDSELSLARWPAVAVGPRRVVPLAAVGMEHRSVAEQLRALRGSDVPARGVEPAGFVLRGPVAPSEVDEHEASVLAALDSEPVPAVELARRLGLPGPRFLRLRRLEDAGAVVRAGLTPTDLFHLDGLFNAFSTETAAAAFDLCAEVLRLSVDEIRGALWLALRTGIARQIVRAEFEEGGGSPGRPPRAGWVPDERTADFLIDRLFREDGCSSFRLSLARPIVPIGAPVGAVFPSLAAPCGTEVVVPPFAGVANAVGAIAGDVLLAEQVEIVPAADGAFQVQSRLRTVRAFSFAEALDHAEAIIAEGLREKARENGLRFEEPDVEVKESRVETPAGPVFLGVRLTGRLRA